MPITITHTDWRKGAEAEYLKKRQDILMRRQLRVRLIERLQDKVARYDDEVAELDRAAITFGIQPPKPERPPQKAEQRPAPSSGVPQFKDVALDFLREAYPQTRKASQVLQRCEADLARKFHPKTAGMTLYRLAKDRLVERVGKSNWRYVPQDGDEGLEADASGPSLFS